MAVRHIDREAGGPLINAVSHYGQWASVGSKAAPSAPGACNKAGPALDPPAKTYPPPFSMVVTSMLANLMVDPVLLHGPVEVRLAVIAVLEVPASDAIVAVPAQRRPWRAFQSGVLTRADRGRDIFHTRGLLHSPFLARCRACSHPRAASSLISLERQPSG